MDLVVFDPWRRVLRPYRGTNAEFQTSWETQYGNLLGYDLDVGAVADRRSRGRACSVRTSMTRRWASTSPTSVSPTLRLASSRSVRDSGCPIRPQRGAHGGQRGVHGQQIRYCIIFDATNFGADQREHPSQRGHPRRRQPGDRASPVTAAGAIEPPFGDRGDLGATRSGALVPLRTPPDDDRRPPIDGPSRALARLSCALAGSSPSGALGRAGADHRGAPL